MAKILVIEDDKNMRDAVQDNLEFDGHLVESVASGEEALAILAISEYDLIVLDLGLPGVSGVDLCSRFRASGGQSPVLILTANEDLHHKDQGFSAGADDYLTKPFHQKELLLRVRALLRRAPSLKEDTLRYGPFVLDPSTRQLTRAGEALRLTPIEFTLLEFMVRNSQRVFTQEELLLKVWPSSSERTANSIRMCIGKIRAKIDIQGEPSFIENLHGHGYRLRFLDMKTN